MKTKVLLSVAASAVLALNGCGGGSSAGGTTTSAPVCDANFIDVVLPSTISGGMTLDATKVYGLAGKVNVTSGVLDIPAGTTIAGCVPNSFMVIEAGAQINAVGTQAEPIVFTSQRDIKGQSADNLAGEWGGLVLAGNAYTHYGVAKYEADETVQFGCDATGVYGPAVPCQNTQSSGDLEYVLIKHSGYEVEKDKELNGLSLAGVGSGTIIKNVAIVGGLDDGMEIWGGTVNIDGLYVYNAQDDSVDTDLGYRGIIQNVLVQQVNVDSTNNHDSSAMEFGNDNNTITTNDSNCTQPDIRNFTAYIKGGGFYNKNDAGFKWNNVKFVSAKTIDQEQVHFRSTDAYDTSAKHINGDVCFKDTAVALTEENTYSKVNSKTNTNPAGENTAYDYFVTNILYSGTGILNYDSEACGIADEATIWKGKAGSNDPLETPAI